MGWRDTIEVHPAADLFPLMPQDELEALAADIKQHGMNVPVVFFVDEHGTRLLDGRNRLDAVERFLPRNDVLRVQQAHNVIHYQPPLDPYELVVSLNILRRHLTTAQKQELIDKLLRENPDRSDRQTATLAKVSPTTVGTRRQRLAERGDIPKVSETVGKDGRIRTATPARSKPSEPAPPPPEAQRHLDKVGRIERETLEGYRAILIDASPEVRGACLAALDEESGVWPLLEILTPEEQVQWLAELNAAMAKTSAELTRFRSEDPELWDWAEALKVWHDAASNEDREKFAECLSENDLDTLIYLMGEKTADYGMWLYNRGVFEDSRIVLLPEGVNRYELDKWLRGHCGKGLDE